MKELKLPKLQKSNPNKTKKKKILLLSDDLRMHSGIATQSKEFVMGTLHKYDWVQIGGAVKHPEQGNIIDMGPAAVNEYGIKDAYLKIYPMSGYGNPQVLREIMEIEKPDAILHFTDPRFWIWLYNMEHELRQNVPILYYNIWDDIPDPKYNTNFYRSSDMLMGISKQTYGINKRILSKYGYEDWQLDYVPHGITDKRIKKIEDKGDTKFKEFQKKYELDKYKFRILYLNRNIRRKSPGDVALAYKHMMDKLTPEQRKDCVFVWHSQPSDENGTDMRAVCQTLLPEYPVIFTYDKGGPMNDEEMNFLYNSIDVYINLASNEGFGLGSCEALHAGKPIIVNVTGGLQDQCGFKKRNSSPHDGSAFTEEYLTAEDYVELKSNHRGTYTDHGEWVKPVFPSNISLAGSPMTPYIFDDRCSFEDAGNALLEWYHEGPEERERKGEIGRQWVFGDDARMTNKHMSESFIKNIENTFKNWKPREKYTMEVV
jgi:glycosyltransferase involved in cell wall biosynthesis